MNAVAVLCVAAAVNVQLDVACAWRHERKLDAHNVEGVGWAKDLHMYQVVWRV
jgi:hypothetical protein